MTTTSQNDRSWSFGRIPTTQTSSTHRRRWSADSDTEHPRGSPPPPYSEPVSTTEHDALHEISYPDDGIDYQPRPWRLQLCEMLRNTEDAMWAVLSDDIDDICAETVLRYRRPTFRVVEHLVVIILNLPIPTELLSVNDTVVYNVAKKVAVQILDEHDWATNEHGPIHQRFGVVLPYSFVPHLERIKAVLRTKIKSFYALLSEGKLRARLETAGSLLASTRRVNQIMTTTGWIYTSHIEELLEQYVRYHLLALDFQDAWIHSEKTVIARLLMIACFTKTDSPTQSLEKMRDRLTKILAQYQFRMVDPLLALPQEWIDAAIDTVKRAATGYDVLIYRITHRTYVCQCNERRTTEFFWCPWHGEYLRTSYSPPPFFQLDPSARPGLGMSDIGHS